MQKISEAEKFIKQGSEGCITRGTDGSEMALELYDQSDIGGSIGIFAAHKPQTRTSSNASASHFTTSDGLIGRTGQFFARRLIAFNLVKEKSRALVETLSQLTAAAAAAHCQYRQQHQRPHPLARLKCNC